MNRAKKLDTIFVSWIGAVVVAVAVDFVFSYFNCIPIIGLGCGEKYSPLLHYSTILTASGTSVAFVLTYLAVRSGLQPTVGELLLRSALHEIRMQYPALYRLFDDNMLSDTELQKIDDFIEDFESDLDEVKLSGKYVDNIDGAERGLVLLRKIFNFAKPPYQRDSHEKLPDPEEFGYGRLRAFYTKHLLYARDTEDQMVHCTVLLVGGIVFYGGLSAGLEWLGWLNASVCIIIAYVLLSIISMFFAFMLTLRLWPQPSLKTQFEDLVKVLKLESRREIMDDIDDIPDPQSS